MGRSVDKLNKERSKCYEEIYERYVKQDFSSNTTESSIDDEYEKINEINEKIYNEMISFTHKNCFSLCEYLDEDIISKYTNWVLTKK